MNTLIDQAIARITDQAMELDNTFTTFIEEHLTEICTNDKVAEKLLNTEKSLEEFLNIQESEMKEQARKKGTGHQCAGLSDAEFYRRAENYFEITEEDKSSITIHQKQDKKIVNIMDLL